MAHAQRGLLAAALLGLATLASGQVATDPQLAIGGFHACAVGAAGGVSCWGDNAKRQLGDGTTVANSTVPRDVQGLSGVAALAAGYRHTCALLTTGGVRCWGENASGQLGDGSFTDRPTPVDVAGVSTAVAIAARNNHTCILTAGGALRCWGENFYGQLGSADGSFPNNRATAATVSGMSFGVVAFGVGGHHTCALKSDGTFWCWGQNWARQLGTPGTTPPTDTPRQLALPSPVRAISLGWEHSCVLDTGGGVVCWGLNDNGQTGAAPPLTSVPGPTRVPQLSSGVASISAGYYHTCAITLAGAMLCWGNNSQQGQGMLGDGTIADRSTPKLVAGLGSGMKQAAAGWSNTGGVGTDGTVLSWGNNLRGAVGDGTYVDRFFPQLVTRPAGAGFLDLTPADGQRLASALQPSFPVVANSTGGGSSVTATADIFARPQDVGRPVNIYVFAWAPREIVQGAGTSAKADPLPCVLAQLTGSGSLASVTSSSIVPLLSNVLSDKALAVDVLRNVGTSGVSGSTFFVGYGSSSSGMIEGGTNRAVVSVPGAKECKPQPPQTGWWWNPLEDGRGFSLEKRGSNLFFAAFLYDVSGRSTWYVATGPVSLDGAFFAAPLYGAKGGQTLGGAYPGRPQLTDQGPIVLAFNTASTGTMIWPGGTVPIQRFDIIPNGLASGPQANLPESGWWWNESESGRGFFLEWQKNTLDIAGYMYDDAGNSVWYLTVGEQSADGKTFAGNWWSYGNGQTLTGPWKPNTRLSTTVAPMSVTFSGPDTAIMTLPNGRTTSLTRHRF